MPLLSSEVTRLKSELGYGILTAGAEPYIGNVYAVFEQVVAVYMTAGASTTSSTTVAAATSPTNVTLTLASALGFAPLALVWVDVGPNQEQAIVSAVSGNTITVSLSKAHSGTYVVVVDGGEQIVRSTLGEIYKVAAALGDTTTAGIKSVDEVEFFGGNTTGRDVSQFGELQRRREYWREELASYLNVPYLRGMRRGAGGAMSVY